MIRNFSSVGLVSGGGLTYTITIENISGAETNNKEMIIKDTTVPSPDLTDWFDSLRPILLRLLGLNQITAIQMIGDPKNEGGSIKERKAVKDLGKTLEAIQYELVNKIQVTKLSFSGSEDKPKVIVTGKIEVPNGAKCALNTPLVSLSGSTFGCEEELSGIIENLLDEVELYEDGKRSQLSMDFGVEEKDEAA